MPNHGGLDARTGGRFAPLEGDCRRNHPAGPAEGAPWAPSLRGETAGAVTGGLRPRRPVGAMGRRYARSAPPHCLPPVYNSQVLYGDCQ